MNQQPLKAWFLLIVLSMIWGSSFILIKRGLVALTPMEVGALRIVSAAFFLIPIALNGLKKINKRDSKYLVFVGFVGSLIPAFLFAFAQTTLSSSITGILNALTPFFTILVGHFIFKVTQNKRVFIGIFIGFLGTFMLTFSQTPLDISFNFNVILILVATFCYGLNLNIIKYLLKKVNPLHITAISLLFVAPMAALYLGVYSHIFTLFFTSPEIRLATTYIVILGVLGTAVALILFNHIVKITDPVFTSSVTYMIPVVAVLWGYWDNESLNILQILGMITIIIGVYYANRIRQKL